MKNILNFFLLLFICVNVNAQDDYPKDGDNIKNPNLEKFVGTWVWKNGDNELILVLKKINTKLIPTANIYGDILYGFHKYIKNGKELENSLQYTNTNYQDKKRTLGAMGNILTPNKIQLSFLPLERKFRTLYANIEYIDNKHIKINDFEKKDELRINDPLDNSRALPQDIILIRQ